MTCDQRHLQQGHGQRGAYKRSFFGLGVLHRQPNSPRHLHSCGRARHSQLTISRFMHPFFNERLAAQDGWGRSRALNPRYDCRITCVPLVVIAMMKPLTATETDARSVQSVTSPWPSMAGLQTAQEKHLGFETEDPSWPQQGTDPTGTAPLRIRSERLWGPVAVRAWWGATVRGQEGGGAPGPPSPSRSSRRTRRFASSTAGGGPPPAAAPHPAIVTPSGPVHGRNRGPQSREALWEPRERNVTAPYCLPTR